MIDILYTKPAAVVRLTIPDKHDWSKVGNFVARQLWPGTDPERADPAFDRIMKDRGPRKIQAREEAYRKEAAKREARQRELLG